MRTSLTIFSAAVLLASILAISGGALAQAPSVPTPDANDLGVSENDVRDEPNHPADDTNGLEDGHDPFFTPKDDRLILDAYTEQEYGALTAAVREDLDAVRNNAQHGNNYENYEEYMYPGKISFEAWYGYWSDTGGGGDLQQSNVTSGQAFVGEANGAIDDAGDDEAGECRSASEPAWDEFVWRGNNNCAEAAGVPAANAPGDTMWAFIQPGTHNMHLNTMVFGCACPDDAPFHNGSDANIQPDFGMEYPEPLPNNPAGGEVWRQSNGIVRYFYDASFLISTQVTTSVNPDEVELGDAAGEPPLPKKAFQPRTGDMYDIDTYTTLNPVVEEAYRTAIWNPPQDYGDEGEESNVLSSQHPEGLKGFLVHNGHDTKQDVEGQVFGTANDALNTVSGPQGLADDVVFGPYKHEPNTAEDDYNGWANFDADTSYGGLDGAYYTPGDDQTYTKYSEEEHFWIDAQASVDNAPVWVPGCCFLFGAGPHITPEVPTTDDPVGSTAQEDDDNTQGPGFLYLNVAAGTWFDVNEDTWVGTAGDDGYPYNNGTTDDPNDYGHVEFRGASGSGAVTWKNAQLVPEDDWGDAGVYVMGTWSDANPYSDAAMDVVGCDADPVLTPLRENDDVGGTVTNFAPQDDCERFSRYRTGSEPIDMTPMAFGSGTAGQWYSGMAVLFPTGSLDTSFDVRVTAELNKENRVAKSRGDATPNNAGVSLDGETITDVDHIDAIME